MSARRVTHIRPHVSPGIIAKNPDPKDSSTQMFSGTGEFVKKAALLLGIGFVVAVTTAVPVQPGKNPAPSNDIAAQGHAKRYLRMNEYLFHGIQKTTAIAFHSAELGSTLV